ncbi:hypothetical protein ACWD7T_10910 [Streptomyces sp. 900116325]
MTPRTATVTSELLTALPAAAGPLLLRSLGLVDRPRDLKAERDYADSVAHGYITLPAGCSIPTPEPTAEQLNRVWDDLAPCPLDGGLPRLLNDARSNQTRGNRNA